jgi:DNA end-binding protein Ku
LPDSDKELRRRSFWSGTITFGLVSIPVALLPGHRPSGASLRMLAPDGTPLIRRYFCPKDDRFIDREEIVRGYEVRKDSFVVVTDEELEALEPKKSREIDLRRFVPLGQIDPSLFDRPYFLVPSGQSAKPYRLLAETMERTGRAGIATFVMRTREYLVAIIAERSILRAETLRFAEELRSPGDLGLPSPADVSEAAVRHMAAEIDKTTRQGLDPDQLIDRQSLRLLELVQRKRAAGADVVSPEAVEPFNEEEEKVIDIMQLLKQSLGQPEDRAESAADRVDGREAELRGKTRDELYRMAKELNIPGRSGMSREELVQSLLRMVEEEEAS